MPGFDGTGPFGQGPMTGKGRGYCIIPLDKKRKVPLSHASTKGDTISLNYPFNNNKTYDDLTSSYDTHPKKRSFMIFWQEVKYFGRFNTRSKGMNRMDRDRHR